MSEKLTFEKLKQLANDQDLDLSTMQIKTIPVRDLAKLPRITHLDLSNNQIVEIPAEFCSKLKQLKYLDLSRNQIGFLPDNFGELSNLQKLNLHSNMIEELPLSFSKLTKLKWLNMKDNQLDDSLTSTAARFENCEFAAPRVVEFVKAQEALHKKILQNQKVTLEKTDAAKKAVQDQEKAVKKKKKKAKKSGQQENLKSESEEDHANAEMTEEEIVNRANEFSSNEKRKNSSFRDIVRITLWILILSSIISLLFGFVLYDNCTVPSHRWIPQSAEFCTDATRSWTRRQISPTLKENLKKVLISMFGVVSNEASAYLNEVSELGIWDSILVFTNTLHTKLVGLFLLTQRAFGEMKDSLISLFNENSNNLIVEYLKYVAECVILSLKIALAIGRDLVATAADYAMDLIVWSKDFFTLAMENPSQAWLRFKTILNLA